MLPLSLELKAAGILLALAGVLGAVAWAAHHERAIGAAEVQQRWDAKTLADTQADEAQSALQREQSRAAAAGYEARKAAAAGRAAPPSPEVRDALTAPICPPAGASAPLELGNVSLPAVVLDRLRRAGADF